MGSATLVRSARHAARLSQAELARRAGTSQAALSLIESGARDPSTSLLERLLSASGPASLVVARGVWCDAAGTAQRIAEALRNGSVDRAFRAWLDLADQLNELDGLERAGPVLTCPNLTGAPVWDAALAGLVRHKLAQGGLPAPLWADEPERALPGLTTLRIADVPIPVAVDPASTPPAFLAHGVLVDEAWLESV